MAIVKPGQMDFSNKNIIMIISGMPGVGKTTLALSAPDCVLIDADEGIVRVRPEHRKDSIIVSKYEDLLADIKEIEGQYQDRIPLPGELIHEVYASMDMVAIKEKLRERLEDEMANRVADKLMTEFANDIKQVMGNREVREDLRHYVRQIVRGVAEPVSEDYDDGRATHEQ